MQLHKWDQAIDYFQKVAEGIQYKTPDFVYNNLGLPYYKKDFLSQKGETHGKNFYYHLNSQQHDFYLW